MTEAPRRDIQALRAVAVTMVVVFHLWPAALPGGYIGVDVFLVISGYLITRHLLQPNRGGLADFWARRVRRLLPAATAALVGTAILAFALMPATGFAQLTQATTASAFAIENWNLIAQASDYLAAEDDPSPVQHFWSLGVEEQFYLVWPIIIALCFLPRFAKHSRKAVAIAVTSAVAVSLAASVLATGGGAAFAYFATVTRIWELGIGAMVAVWHTQLVGRGPTGLRRAVWWLAAIAVMVSAVTFSDLDAFPGYRAALPVVATAAMIAAAGDGLRWTGERLYASAPVQWIGDRSYSIYLWHWPLIIAVGAVVPGGITLAVVVLAATALLAALSKRWLEDVPRRSPRLVGSRKATGALLVACTALSLAAAGGLWLVQRAEVSQGETLLAQAANEACLGAAATRDADCAALPLATTPVQASQDKPAVYANDCWNNRPFTARVTCGYGESDALVKVALYGNSHAGQWFDPVYAAASSRGWSLSTFLASGCYSVDVLIEFGSDALNQNCLDLQQWGSSEIVDKGFDIVVMANRSHQRLADVASADKYGIQVESYTRVVSAFVDAGTKVVVIRDTPYPEHDIPQCLASKVTLDCSSDREEALPADPLVEAAMALGDDRVVVLDVTDLMCGPERCEPIIGGLIVNFDRGHLTGAFSSSMEPEVGAALDAALASS